MGESLEIVSMGIPGSFSFLQRQDEQGRSSSWDIPESNENAGSCLAALFGTNTEASIWMISAPVAFRHGMCLDEAPHRADASAENPTKRAKTTSKFPNFIASCFIDR
jgi:hypothetical protein